MKILARASAIAFCGLTAVTAAFGQTQSLTFMPALYPSGANVGNHTPSCVIATDVNGDGKPDLVCANGANTTPALTVLTNDGRGDFGSNAVIDVGSGATWVAAADVNGDGWPDLIYPNGKSPGTLTVMTNNGQGSFGSNATLAVGFGPMRVVAADINGDGNVDLISMDLYGETLTVLTNNGSGDFGSNATLNVGTFPGSLIAADLNGDGKVDLICGSAYSDTLTVFTNNGRGQFGSNATYVVGSWPNSVAAADVNGDGKLDLITANYSASSGDTLTVLTNNGSGVFGSNATLAVGNGPTCVIAVDINGDGKPDLICANQTDVTLTLLTNNGSGDFGSNTTLEVNSYPVSLAAADINGDGKLDLISGDHEFGVTAQIQVGFTTWKYATTNDALSIAVMDVNNDGKPDLVTANGNYIVHNSDAGSGDTLTVLTNTGSGLFGFYTNLGVGSGPDCVIAADVNRDGKLDLISANANASGFGSLSILTNNGLGGFDLDELLSVGEYGDPTCVAAVDVDSIGKIDLAAVVNGELQLFTNNGDGVIAFNAVVAAGDDPSWVVAADVNGDGRADLILANSLNSKPSDPNGTLTVFTNNGSGGFVSNATYEVGRTPTCFVAADINGDGKVDLITANNNVGTLTVLTNNGSGVFVSNVTYEVGFQPRCVVTADINGDGWPDLIAATVNVDEPTGNSLVILTNNGSGFFGFYASIATDVGPNWVTAADVNGDGKPDLIVTSADGTLTVLINTTGFSTPTALPNLSVTLSGPNLVMSWSSSATNLVVQTNSDLSNPRWGTASYIISTNGNVESITIPEPPGDLFLRLFRP